MATTSLGIHYFIKDGHRDSVLSKLKGVIELCTKEPEFINAIISETSERPTSFSCMSCGAVRGPILMLSKESNLIARHIWPTSNNTSKRWMLCGAVPSWNWDHT
jgi:5-methylcytosine-specific restriction endonuclease McrA